MVDHSNKLADLLVARKQSSCRRRIKRSVVVVVVRFGRWLGNEVEGRTRVNEGPPIGWIGGRGEGGVWC